MYCYKCGKEIRDDSNYCPHCGAKIDSKDSNIYESNSKSKYDQRIKVDTNEYEFNVEDKQKFYWKYFLIGLIPVFGMIYSNVYMTNKDKERAKYRSLYIGISVTFFLIFTILLIWMLVSFINFPKGF